METILSYLPKSIEQLIKELPSSLISEMEEIRLRVTRPIEIVTNSGAQYLPYIFQQKDAEQFLQNLSYSSFYTLEEELKRGFITIEGGHRIGLAGKVILENGFVKAIRDIASFNIRVAREKIGIANSIIPFIYENGWKHTIIIGPPQTGKTTLLRDLARIISTGDEKRGIFPQKVGIVDERSEIAGCVGGVPQLTFGPRVDVLDACPKVEGMMMMIRSMSPNVLVVDEIGRKEDSEAIMEAVHAGIRLIMTTHGDSLEDISRRPTLQSIINQRIFERYIELSKTHLPGYIQSIKDENGHDIRNKVRVSKVW